MGALDDERNMDIFNQLLECDLGLTRRYLSRENVNDIKIRGGFKISGSLGNQEEVLARKYSERR